jgi:HSP20 family protein
MFLIPYVRSQRREAAPWSLDAFDRIFDDLTKDLVPNNQRAEGAFLPSINVAEDEDAYHVEAELPGLQEKDVDVSLANDTLTISGERKQESEEKAKKYVRRESVYGSFQRQISLPSEIESDKIEASFKNGVLSVTLPKSKRAKEEVRKIAVKSA